MKDIIDKSHIQLLIDKIESATLKRNRILFDLEVAMNEKNKATAELLKYLNDQ